MSAPQDQSPNAPRQPLSFEELDAALEARRQRRLGESLDGGRLDVLLVILALPPRWTEPLIHLVVPPLLENETSFLERAASYSPAWLDQLEEEGWIRRSVGVSIEGEDAEPAVIEVESQATEPAISKLLSAKGGDRIFERRLARLGEAIAEEARKLGALDESGNLTAEPPPILPKITLRWAALIDAYERRSTTVQTVLAGSPVASWRPVADELEARIRRSSAHEGLRLLEAAKPLAAFLSRLLDTTLELAVRRASLALELQDRRRHDLQHLEIFLARDDQISALRHLIDSAGDEKEPWALHLLGSGGVGKTMLLRHLTAQMADREALTVGRVDFDFLNPDYPRLAPGLLLWAFAQELRAFDQSGRAAGAFESSERTLRYLHEELQGGEVKIDRATEHPLFTTGLEEYARALEELPSPVILVIDTCEELTKPRAGVDAQQNVDETFHILERLRRLVPSLRVVFAGRRALASAGAGWSCETCELKPRPYLSLFEMRGFTVDEAERFLGAVGVPPELIGPVVQRSSPDAGGAAQIVWDDLSQPENVLRCNPYELRFFADWARDDPPPSPEDIEHAGGERYIELRILGRLESQALEDLLPILGLARHADSELLAALTGLGGGDLEDFLLILQHQEWMDRRIVHREASIGAPRKDAAKGSGKDSARRIFSVEEGLSLRLQSYYQSRPGELEMQRQTAARVLGDRLLRGDPAELHFTDLDSALRVMAGVEDADAWWRQFEERLFEVRDAEWVAQQMGLLTGPEGVVGEPDDASWPELRKVHPLRPAVVATQALAESQLSWGGLTPWMEVAETARSLPLIGADLELRAKAMQLAAELRVGQDPSPQDARTVWRLAGRLEGLPSPQTAAAVVAALEAVVEKYEEDPERIGAAERLLLGREDIPSDLPMTLQDHSTKEEAGLSVPLVSRWIRHVFEVWRGAGGPDWLPEPRQRALEAMVYALDGRVCAALGRVPERATSSFARALELANGADLSGWQTWVVPESLKTRICLEAIRALYPQALSPQQTFERFNHGRFRSGIDGDRFQSALSELALAEGRRAEVFKLVSRLSADEPLDSAGSCRAHFELPPLALQRIRMDAVTGDLEMALNRWDVIGREADRYDITVLRHAARAELRWAIRLRLLSEEPGAALSESEREEDRNLLKLAEAIGGVPRKKKATSLVNSLRTSHEDWQRRIEPTEERLEEAMAIASDRLPEIDRLDPDPLDLHLVFDGLEAARLAGGSRLSGDLERHIGSFDVAMLRDPEAAWRLHLRRLATWPDSEEPDGSVVDTADDSTWSDRLGLRRAGIIAWEEADLLALRRPDEAELLFHFAHLLLRKASDPLGEAITSTARLCCLLGKHPAGVEGAVDDLEAAWRRLSAPIDRGDDTSIKAALDAVPAPLRVWWLRASQLRWAVKEDFEKLREGLTFGRSIVRDPREPLAAALERSMEGAENADGAFGSPSTGFHEVPPPKTDHTKAKSPSTGLEEVPKPTSMASTRPDSDSQGEDEVTTLKPRLVDRIWTGVGMLLGLVVVIAFFAGLYWLSARLFGFGVVGSILTIFLALGLAAWGGGLVLAVYTLLRRSRRLVLVVPFQNLLLKAQSFEGGVSLRQKKISFKHWPPWVDVEHTLGSVKAAHVDFSEESYAVAGASFREQLGPLVAGANGVDFQLGDWHGFPWEGELAELFASESRTRFRREIWRSPGLEASEKSGPQSEAGQKGIMAWPEHEAATQDQRAILVLAASALGRDAAVRGYSRLDPWGIDVVFAGERELRRVDMLAELGGRGERVVHLVGTFIQSKSGLRFRLGGARGQGLDLRPQDIAEAFSEAWMIVLQEEPLSETNWRSQIDRRRGQWLREFAGEIAEHGAPAVLTLPRLEVATASACVEEIAKLLRPRSSLLQLVLRKHAAEVDLSLLDAVDRIRRQIRGAERMDPEAAWDVVLYAPVGWRHPFGRERPRDRMAKRESHGEKSEHQESSGSG